MRRNRGITLVALIITIVVMLILVAVSVNVLIKSNLIGTAEKAVDKYKTASEEEAKGGEITINGKKYNSIEEYLGSKENEEVKPGVRAEKESEYEGATIPEGFTISKIPGETTVNGGLVIYDIPAEDLKNAGEDFWTKTTTVGTENYPTVQCNYNQFVWVPVETPVITETELNALIKDTSKPTVTDGQTAVNYLIENEGKYPMAVEYKTADGTTNYRGILYEFSEGEQGVAITACEFSITDNYDDASIEYVREPAKLTDEYSIIEEKEQALDLQTEYNNIVKSIKLQKGFWVARYELSHSSVNNINKAESKRGKKVSNVSETEGLNSWYGVYDVCQQVNLQSGTGVKSSMIYGSQWDQIMIWMKDVRNASTFYILDSSNMGNYNLATGGTKAEQVSGYLDKYAVKQVFDLGGNLYDFTVEANGTERKKYAWKLFLWKWTGETSKS